MSLDLERQRLIKERQRLKEFFENPANKPADHVFSDEKSNNTGAIIPANISQGQDKNTKDWFNLEVVDASCVPKNKSDDMEQWVSDTFYSYFPGFNNEYQKRQLYLQRRLRENQENLIKHQILNAGQGSKRKLSKHANEFNTQTVEPAASSARSNNSTITSNDTLTSNECTDADKEIINVKNPNYISSNHVVNSARPGSTRYKLLQDLQHTNLSNAAPGSGEDVTNLNRRHVEIESARKKEYQRELMQQIEEKRRSIKFLKEKERQQEEVLTRRLQEQLKTMKLEEKLEKERIKATKIRFNAEQNRSMREHILAKLENDSKLLPADRSRSFLDEKVNKENISSRNENKVYKYFSNSEKNEYNYRKKPFIPADIGQVIDQVDFPKIEMECFHISEKICPMCDGPLKEFLDFCLRCQSRISLPPKIATTENTQETENVKRKPFQSKNDKLEETISNTDGSDSSYFLVCNKCERVYSTCSTCLNKSDLCRACQSKRSVCMNCRRSLCSFCLEEVACGKNSENIHVNESDSLGMPFQVITANGEETETLDDNRNSRRDVFPSETINLSVNNLSVDEENNAYHKNIRRDSIFHPNRKLTSQFIYNKPSNLEIQEAQQNLINSFQKDDIDNIKDDSEYNIEKLRHQTDVRLTRYLKNYGELAVQSRGTQTTPNTNARRDIVINGENSLSIPLLREMPKMTRRESTKSKKSYSNDLENLQTRWEIPAVQKFTVSPTSPKVVTQIGAIRKQLQTETFFNHGY